MPDKRYFLETMGCQMNVLDSELVAGQLRALGYERTSHPKDADVVLVNTCSVRGHAEDKVYSRLGEFRRLKRRRPEMIIGVIGCMAERDGDNILARCDHVDLLCGPGNLNEIPALIATVEETRQHLDQATNIRNVRGPCLPCLVGRLFSGSRGGIVRIKIRLRLGLCPLRLSFRRLLSRSR